jgi:hypothetical protein
MADDLYTAVGALILSFFVGIGMGIGWSLIDRVEDLIPRVGACP